MTIDNFYEFLRNNVPGFENPEKIEIEGTAFHYTNNWEKIKTSNKFLGAPIDRNLDFTQKDQYSKPAKFDPGIVFAYESLNDAKAEGWGCDIVEIRYSKAIKAYHKSENELDEFTNTALENIGFGNGTDNPQRLATLLIINSDILRFKKSD